MKLTNATIGCFPNPPDSRDIVLGDIPFILDPNCPTYKVGFDNEDKYGKIKRDHQGKSLSCVGQAWSKYLEMINKIDTNELKDLSARDVYSQIYLPNGGAYIRDGARTSVNVGCCEEIFMPSYDNGNPEEPFMRTRTESDLIKSNALIYKSQKYVWLDTSDPFTEEDWENMRQVIWQFGGFVSGWSGHCVYALGYGIKDGYRFIHFVNSYGEGSDWYLWEGKTDYKYYNCVKYKLYDITFLVDLPNNKKTMRYIIIGTEQYLIYDELKLALNIGNVEILKQLQANGLSGNPVKVDKLPNNYIVYPLVNKDLLRDIFGF